MPGPVLVVGGYGVFGSLAGRELAALGVRVTIAGRSGDEAARMADRLGPGHGALALDLRDPDAARRAVASHPVVVNATATASGAGAVLLQAALEVGAHHVDISEDRRHGAAVRAAGPAFAARGLTAAYGCSSLPGISLALLAKARTLRVDPPAAARAVLYIGGDNPRGTAAVQAACDVAGRPIHAPQGELTGFGPAEAVELPGFGRRRAWPFDGAEYDLLPVLHAIHDVRVLVGFEMPAVGAALRAVGRCPPGSLPRRLLVAMAPMAPRWGSSGGAVHVELSWADGETHRATAWATRDGQRLAALPAALAAARLAAGETTVRGAVTAPELLGWQALLDELSARGFRVESS